MKTETKDYSASVGRGTGSVLDAPYIHTYLYTRIIHTHSRWEASTGTDSAAMINNIPKKKYGMRHEHKIFKIKH